MTLIGHTKTFDHFVRLLSPPQRRAFGLIAPEGVGRQHFLREAFLRVGGQIPGPDIKELSTGSIDSSREALPWAETPPVQAPFKYLLLPWERLTQDSKGLWSGFVEDLPDHLVVCFFAESLPDEIVAKLYPLRLFTLSRPEAEEIWTLQSISSGVFKQFWDVAPGQPGLASQRFSNKYSLHFNTLLKIMDNKPTAMSFMQSLDQLPPWSAEEAATFWQWAIPRLFKMKHPSDPQSKFWGLASETVSQHPGAPLTFLLPSLFYSVFEV